MLVLFVFAILFSSFVIFLLKWFLYLFYKNKNKSIKIFANFFLVVFK
ncbi:hypothetical protein GCW_92861 [Mycoplasmoides gallisepticum S6]|uniref:Uncharacterized protein n=1 Tax=Mycoplasmoides gallisepticum S6 TaxID=1006581 RepID=A0A0F6CM15_MYCGL|nr:hypothetical protein GCW_92861 [Mycoplasmoides gallisepticum S6]